MTAVTRQAVGGLAFLIAALGAALFGPARTFDYWQAWAFLAVFGSTTLAITIYLARRDPALLARRVHAGPTAEPEPRLDEEALLVASLPGYVEYRRRVKHRLVPRLW